MGSSLSFAVDSMSPTQIQITVFGESGIPTAYRMELINNTTGLTYVNQTLLDGGVVDPPAGTYIMNLSDFIGPGNTVFAYTVGDYITMGGMGQVNDGTTYQNFTASYFGPLNAIFYYSTQAAALAGGSNYLAYSGGYTVQSEGGTSTWKIASNSTGSSAKTGIYPAGNDLNSDGVYFLYPANPCFLEGSTLRCLIYGIEKDVPIERLKKGMLVKTKTDGYKAVHSIGFSIFAHVPSKDRIENQLYVCPMSAFPELTADLVLTGAHAILVDSITEKQHTDIVNAMGGLYLTGRHVRLMAYLDDRTAPYPKEGTYSVWHLALENDDIYMNYGVYANGGLLVETTSIRFLNEVSNMTLM